MNKKPSIGIITLHYVDNHGGVLLAYALQEKIRQLGYAPLLIDYDPTPVPSWASHALKTWVYRLVRLPTYLRRTPEILRRLLAGGAVMPPRHAHKSSGVRASRFESFRARYISTTLTSWHTANALRAEPPVFDAYVCGSDQVWNPYMCRPDGRPGLDGAYFLDFAPQQLRVSYAPSVSVPEIPRSLRADFSRLASRIRFLSCREEAGAHLVEELTGRSVKVVIDPALLLSPEDWLEVAKRPPEGRYLLCYFLGDGAYYREFTRSLADRLGIPVKVISSSARDADELGAEPCHDIGPDEFLGLIQNAQCVCTDSFHGTLFSIIFERLFFVFERPGSSGSKSMSSRIHSILGRLGLIGQLVHEGQDAKSARLAIDYESPRQRLAELREDSVSYLRDALAATQVKL